MKRLLNSFLFVFCLFTLHTTQATGQNLPVQELLLPEENASSGGFDIWDVAFSPDGTLMAIAGSWFDGFVWNLNTNELKVLKGAKNLLARIDISSDAKKITAFDWDNMIHVWDYESGEVLLSFQQRNWYPSSIASDIKFLSDDQNLLTSYSPGRGSGSGMYIWDASTGELLRHIPEILAGNFSILSDDGRFIFDPGTQIVDIEKGITLVIPTPGWGYAINPEFTEIYGLTHIDLDRFYYMVWDARTGEVLRQGPEEMRLAYPTEPGVDLNHEHIVWSRDGRFMFVGGVTRIGGSAVMNARTGEVLRMHDVGLNVNRREFEVQQVRFLPDGKRVAVAGGRYVQIYDLGDLITDVADSEMHGD